MENLKETAKNYLSLTAIEALTNGERSLSLTDDQFEALEVKEELRFVHPKLGDECSLVSASLNGNKYGWVVLHKIDRWNGVEREKLEKFITQFS